MQERFLDYVLVPSGLLLMGVYHVWLFITILFNPRRTVIGLNAECRQAWVFSIMNDPMKNGVLAVQTIRNNIMASTLLATVAITLCSLISVVVSTTITSPGAASKSTYTRKLPGLRTPFFAPLYLRTRTKFIMLTLLENLQDILSTQVREILLLPTKLR
ncbi:hypothetical protein I3760_15G120100 [Carya illinoinensis]|nr:hypothetical protein I3760_15G120100 [Carya illinoinensis]